MNPRVLFETVLNEDRKTLACVSKKQVNLLIEEIDNANRVFCAAQGRSGYILRCFCMRLMQFGYPVFYVGETITPRICQGDMLIVLSGTGQTPLTQEWVRIARQQGATTFGVIGAEDSPIGRSLDYSLFLPAGSKISSSRESSSIQPPGSLFEQGAFILLESIVLTLYKRHGSNPEMTLNRHANLE